MMAHFGTAWIPPPTHTHMYTVQLLFAFCYIDRKKNEIL